MSFCCRHPELVSGSSILTSWMPKLIQHDDQVTMLYQKFISFIKYHNAFTIGLLILFIINTAVFADENVRDSVIGKEVKEVKGVNNEALLEVDLVNFDLVMKIVNIQEDSEKFYIDYTFKTFEIKDSVWQEVAEDQVLIIDKNALADRDLGVYIAKELGEVVDSQLVYLNKAQIQEKEKGQTMALETIDYTGLIGLVMSPKTKELVGYTPELNQEATDLPRVFQGEGSIQSEMFSAGQAAQKLLEIKRQEEQAEARSDSGDVGAEGQRTERENVAQGNNNDIQVVPADAPEPLPAEARSDGGDIGVEEGAVPETSSPDSEVLPPDASLDAPSEQLTLPPGV